MSRTDNRSNKTSCRRSAREALLRRRIRAASAGAAIAGMTVFGSLVLTSNQAASATTSLGAAAVPASVGADDPPAPANPNDMPMDMPGMDMGGGTPAPTDVPMPQDMPGMDMGGGSSPEPTIPADMPPDMPGMDMPGDSHGHDDTTGAAGHRPLTPVLGTFGGATSAVLLTAGLLRRKDRAAGLAKRAARITGRAKK